MKTQLRIQNTDPTDRPMYPTPVAKATDTDRSMRRGIATNAKQLLLSVSRVMAQARHIALTWHWRTTLHSVFLFANRKYCHLQPVVSPWLGEWLVAEAQEATNPWITTETPPSPKKRVMDEDRSN